ncbi:hypothetical protein [Ornithinimicrobium avium]|uniref:Histidine kinase n=1 Tax=Ornithinimicrobium avium TaxID=2283195 RepID=A0A345NR46_9MICO|nr:hypothetical protein [Ornithinimicrobium avium]AXH97504.1 hypothetical protein DV701_16540 [Ornithinimicrobium avium]
MDLHPYLDSVARDLDHATSLADDHVRDIAGRLAAALEPGLRLALVRAMSDTAALVNTELDDAVVTVTMGGSEPVVTVTRTGHGSGALAGPVLPTPPAPPAPPEVEIEGGDTARISLRLPEQLKVRAEERAAQAGQSLNTWLVHTVRAATSGDATAPDPTTTTAVTGARRVTGWA